MQTVTLKFDVSGQNLIAGYLTRYASNTVNYVKAVFDLDGNWNSFDSVRAVWSTDFECISTVLDSEGVCYVPQEVLKRTGNVMVNLVGSIAENDELTDRLTTYPVVALVINANAKVCGTETAEVTPSQFEQYVAMVVAEVEKVTGMTATAVALPEGSAPTAVYENGVLTLGIPKGDKGETGNGISSVEFNADYSLTFNFTESEPYTTPSIRGERGAQGYGIVSVEKIGTAGLVDTYQVNYEDPSVPPTTFTVTNGAKGDTGNGISSVTKTGTVGLVDTYRITFTNGGHYDFNVTNGAKGDTGATGNGIATIAKTSTSGLVDTYTITFTDGTSTTFEVTNGQDGEVTYDELSELLPTETASGDIASFNDGQAVIPAVSCVADIDPIQDLHGYDKPWAGGAGKNKFSNSLYYVGYASRLWENGSFQYTITNTGTGFKANVDANAGFGAYFGYLEANKTYTISYSATGQASGTTFSVRRTTTNVLPSEDMDYSKGLSATTIASLTTTGGTFTTDETAHYWLGLYDATSPKHEITLSNVQLELGSTATSYETYSNICPISGHDEVTVTVADDVDNPTVSEDYTDALPTTVYGGTLDLVSGVLTVTHQYISDFSNIAFGLNGRTTNYTEIYTAISPTKANGTDNVISNMLETGKYDYGGINGRSGNGNLYFLLPPSVETALEGKQWLIDNGVTICYELATPQTYQLTPLQIDTLKGQNNITATSGKVSVTYKADIQKYIDNAVGTKEEDMVANNAITSGSLFSVNDQLYKATATIAVGETITVGVNCTETSIIEELNSLITLI